jgi:hypothetical protein
VLIAVVAGCGQATTPTARDGGVLAAPAATAADAPKSIDPPPSAATTPAPAAVTSPAPPTQAPVTAAPAPQATPAPSVPLLVPVPPALESPAHESPAHESPAHESPAHESEVTVPDAVSINSARVIVNQSNVVSTGGGTGSSASSVVDSDAARVAVRLGANGIEIASLDVHPGWTEASRSQSPQQLLLRYVSGASVVDITLTSNGTSISSSVVASSDR